MGSIETDLRDSFNSYVESRVRLLLGGVSQYLVSRDIKAYVVGGVVRDLMMARSTVDVDLAVGSDALEVASGVAVALNGRYVLLDKENRIARVVFTDDQAFGNKGRWQLDFATYEGSIEQDLARRDFTIDAMALDLAQLTEGCASIRLVDPCNGRDDLDRRVIRAVTDAVFTADAVRLLRAVRLAAELGFSLDQQTEDLIQSNSHLINNVAGERVREELLRVLSVSPAERILYYLDKLGLLTAIFPEMAATKGVRQPKEHFWDVFDHSLKTVSAVEFLLRQGTWQYAGEEILEAVPWSSELAEHFGQISGGGRTRSVLLKLAALLHDVAKPQAKTVDTDGRMRFLGHAREGAAVVANMLERLRFSSKEIRLVETMVEHHLRPGQMGQNELPSRRAIYRYFRDTADAGIDILFLNLADHLATGGANLIPDNWREHVQMVDYVLCQHLQEEDITCPPKLIDGHDLINIFSMNRGPEIGVILEAVREAQVSGEVATRQQALDYARDCLLSKTE